MPSETVPAANMHETSKPPAHIKGLRSVATLEFSKGVGAILFACWLLSLSKTDVPDRAGDAAVRVLDFLHSAPGGHFAIRLLSLAASLTPRKVVKMAFLAFGYGMVRFLEAYGLWNARAWAEWFALLGGAAYLPWEVYEIVRRATPFRWGLLIVNVIIVIYMAYVRMTDDNNLSVRAPGPGARNL
jgi:uncharacterized membrane protein (DUF2068 family)